MKSKRYNTKLTSKICRNSGLRPRAGCYGNSQTLTKEQRRERGRFFF